MTMAKMIFAKQTVAHTRRTWLRMYMLRPDMTRELQNAIGYFHAEAVRLYGQTPHVFMTMCNHIHVVQTDEAGTRGKYMEFFHGQVAKYINEMLDRRGSVWHPNEKPGDQWLADRDAIEDKILYTLMNPVRAGIISKLEDWEHYKVTPDDWGKTLTFKKPPRLRGPKWPPEAKLFPVCPAEFAHMDDPVAYFNSLIDVRTKVLHNELKKAGTRIKTMQESYNLNVTDTPESQPSALPNTPKSKEISQGRQKNTPRKRAKNNPTFQASTADLNAAIRKGKREFNEQYRDALAAFYDDKSAAFPFGTYAMRIRHNVDMDEPDPCSVFVQFVITPEPDSG